MGGSTVIGSSSVSARVLSSGYQHRSQAISTDQQSLMEEEIERERQRTNQNLIQKIHNQTMLNYHTKQQALHSSLKKSDALRKAVCSGGARTRQDRNMEEYGEKALQILSQTDERQDSKSLRGRPSMLKPCSRNAEGTQPTAASLFRDDVDNLMSPTTVVSGSIAFSQNPASR